MEIILTAGYYLLMLGIIILSAIFGTKFLTNIAHKLNKKFDSKSIKKDSNEQE